MTTMLFSPPDLTAADLAVIGEIDAMRRDLRQHVHDQKRWTGLLLAERFGLPERATIALFDAAQGLKVRRRAYERSAEVEPATAGRDLRTMTAAGLLRAQGETRGRYYVGDSPLHAARISVQLARQPVIDPYARLAEAR